MSMRRRLNTINAGAVAVNDATDEKHLGSSKHHSPEKLLHIKTDTRGDRGNIALLIFLYVLQGMLLGLITAIPRMLRKHGVSYKEQTEFSFASLPFSMRLLWAPMVDSLYWPSFGRRKSWLIPTQYLIGIFMLFLSWHVDHWLAGVGGEPNVPLLTRRFFLLNFLVATQDIAVDSWALIMLKRCNVGYAATCNSVGQTVGYFLGYVAFLALESKDFCNTYLRTIPQSDGMVTLSGFLLFCGLCFMVATTLVAFFKQENEIEDADMEEHKLNVRESYKIIWDLLRMRPIQILAAILLTSKLIFAACDAVTSLKIIEAEVPKEKLALLGISIIPVKILLPLVGSHYTNGPLPMDVYMKAISYRIVFASSVTVIAFLTPYIILSDGQVPIYYYVLFVVNYGLYQIFLYCMFVTITTFFAKISDPVVGGTYMTFLNTLCNLGGNWPKTVILWLVDVVTWKDCVYVDARLAQVQHCNNSQLRAKCMATGGECQTVIDGYYIASIICVVYGILWLSIVRKWMNYLQDLPLEQWLVVKRDKQREPKKSS